MEKKEDSGSSSTIPEELPSLFRYITAKDVAGFDNIDYSLRVDIPRSNSQSEKGPLQEIEVAISENSENIAEAPQRSVGEQLNPSHHHAHSFSFSVPSSPSKLNSLAARKVMFNNQVFTNGKSNLSPDPSGLRDQKPKLKFHSQPISTSNLQRKSALGDGRNTNPQSGYQRISRTDSTKDKRFDFFKTWSGKLEWQLPTFRGKPPEIEPQTDHSQTNDTEPLPVDRYFDALEGPELDTLKASEVSALPENKKWPFLLRLPISSFGICLGVSSQAILWKTLATSASTKFLNVSLAVNLVLWCISIALVCIVSSFYFLKIIFYFEAFRREYYHPVRVNFFFAPWITCLFLVLGVPPRIAVHLHSPIWYALMTPILCLELKIYGQWMSGGQRRLSKVANPSNHLSVVGNFVGALLGASMGLKEGPIFFFAIGLAHYTVLFVTLYQRLPTNETLPKELHPVFFLFVAAPSVACMAWANITGSFDYGSKVAYFIALFLYFSLAVRINFFRGFRFSLAWWAYTFPMTGAAIATIRYSKEVKNPFTQTLSVALSAISTLTVTALLISTIIHAFVLRDLFPNDTSIAITGTKLIPTRWYSYRRQADADVESVLNSSSATTNGGNKKEKTLIHMSSV